MIGFQLQIQTVTYQHNITSIYSIFSDLFFTNLHDYSYQHGLYQEVSHMRDEMRVSILLVDNFDDEILIQIIQTIEVPYWCTLFIYNH